jgi:WD40 repeat protein
MITRTTIDNKPIIEIDNFLTDHECDQLLSDRMHKFEKAITHYPAYYRNNNRLEEDNKTLSTDLLKNAKQLNVLELKNALRLNERLRFCQYQQGQKFTKHQDGVYYPNETEASSLTFLLYLNDAEEFEGGETQFFNSKIDDQFIQEVTPAKGKLVIFDHTLWHNGNEITKGTKYVLRTDFIFENKDENHHKGYIWCLAKLLDGTFLSGGRDKLVKHWNKDFQLLNSFRIHEKSIIKILEIEKDEFVSSSRDMTLKKWNLEGKEINSVKVPSMVLTIALCGERVITGDANGKITVYTKELHKLADFTVHSGWIWEIIVNNGIIYSVSDDGTLRKTDANGNSVKLLSNRAGLFSVAMHEEYIYCGSKTGELIRVSVIDGSQKRSPFHQDIIRKIVLENETVITGSEDGTVRINGNEIIKNENFVQDIICVKNQIISAGFDGMLTKAH